VKAQSREGFEMDEKANGKVLKYRKAIAALPGSKQGLPVAERGIQIILKEGIGERLSKIVRPGSESSPEQLRAIAEKIFQSADKKAAEPQKLQSFQSACGGKAFGCGN